MPSLIADLGDEKPPDGAKPSLHRFPVDLEKMYRSVSQNEANCYMCFVNPTDYVKVRRGFCCTDGNEIKPAAAATEQGRRCEPAAQLASQAAQRRRGAMRELFAAASWTRCGSGLGGIAAAELWHSGQSKTMQRRIGTFASLGSASKARPPSFRPC